LQEDCEREHLLAKNLAFSNASTAQVAQKSALEMLTVCRSSTCFLFSSAILAPRPEREEIESGVLFS